jgi:hypothetical protein
VASVSLRVPVASRDRCAISIAVGTLAGHETMPIDGKFHKVKKLHENLRLISEELRDKAAWDSLVWIGYYNRVDAVMKIGSSRHTFWRVSRDFT